MKKEKNKRVRYIWELERFVNRLVAFVNKDFTSKELEAFLEKIFKPFEKIEATYLSQEYPKNLEKFVNTYANIDTTQEQEKIRFTINKEANRLRKLKRERSYKRDKKEWKNHS